MGFYVPGSLSGSYVASQRDEEGSYKYDSISNQLGLQTQGALQSLNKDYATTISNAYSSYLASKQAINTSAMGQGYKESYLEKQQQALTENIASANLSSAQTKNELLESEAAKQTTLQDQYATKVANMERTQSTLMKYRSYLSNLTKDGQSYLKTLGLKNAEDLSYEDLYGAQPAGFTDEKNNLALSYSDWIDTQLTSSTTDNDWRTWLYSGGLQSFKDFSATKNKTTIKDLLSNITSTYSDYETKLNAYNTAKNNYENFSGAKLKTINTGSSRGRSGSRVAETDEWKKAKSNYETSKNEIETLKNNIKAYIDKTATNNTIKQELYKQYGIK